MLEATLNKLNEIIEQLAKRIKQLEAKNRNLRMDVKLWKNRTTEAANAIEDFEELERVRAGVRVSLIAMRTAVKKGGCVSEEQLKDLIDELEAK